MTAVVCPACGRPLLVPRSGLGFGTATADRIVLALTDWAGAGGWVPLDRLREMVGRSPWFIRELDRLAQDGLVERSAETMTANRGPGWIGDLLQPYGQLLGYDAYEWAWAYRLTAAGIRALVRAAAP